AIALSLSAEGDVWQSGVVALPAHNHGNIVLGEASAANLEHLAPFGCRWKLDRRDRWIADTQTQRAAASLPGHFDQVSRASPCLKGEQRAARRRGRIGKVIVTSDRRERAARSCVDAQYRVIIAAAGIHAERR